MLFGFMFWLSLIGGLTIAALGRPEVYQFFFGGRSGSLDGTHPDEFR